MNCRSATTVTWRSLASLTTSIATLRGPRNPNWRFGGLDRKIWVTALRRAKSTSVSPASLAFEHAGFDVQFAREFQMLLQRDRIGRGHHADGEAIGFQIIRHAASAADEAADAGDSVT